MLRAAGREEKRRMPRKLYVGNLPYNTTEQDLQSLFAGAGTVDTVNLMRDMATGQARGFAFVEMAIGRGGAAGDQHAERPRFRRPEPDRQRGAAEGQLRGRVRWIERRRTPPLRAALVAPESQYPGRNVMGVFPKKGQCDEVPRP